MPGAQHGRFCGCAECVEAFAHPYPTPMQSCAHTGCPSVAPAYTDNEGWTFMHGRHYCPTHSGRNP